ncbi:DUF594 family protein [Melia azedarach]|uniref:DUF594 family protein n=1 Tax=Melia azedarach TaxID=155640 RepID=A0ACC1YAU2_MELAZ|nr:DUF594 family protein [Melia azedarach]
MTYVANVAYDENLLLRHIATELLFHSDEEFADEYNYNAREFNKLLSDYMLYLLIMQPIMMSAVAGIGKIRFRDTCAEINRFCETENPTPYDEKGVCEKILGVNTYVKPVAVNGDQSKSVLFDACMLAKELKRLDQEEKGADKLKLMSKIWVE